MTARIQTTSATSIDDIKFACRGIPTCRGVFTTTIKLPNCTNEYSFGGDVVLTGLNLLQSGAVQGTFTATPDFAPPILLPGGLCAAGTPQGVSQFTFTGTWDLRTATGSAILRGGNNTTPFLFRADLTAPEPVFELTPRTRRDPQTVTATAELRYRAADVGRSGGTFVFASAPAGKVRRGLEASAVQLGMAKSAKADPEPCVLAQMSPAGQLQAVSIGQLEAFISGAFSAAGASVSILDNTPTPVVEGSTFYVGYGTTPVAMLDGGIYRNAVTIPGSGSCPPLPYMTSLWWNPQESGWGINLNQQGSILFGTLFTYDAARAPLWLVMSGGALQSDGLTYSGDLYRTTGPAFNANPFTPIGPANLTRVGTMSVAFDEGNAATLTYSVSGTEVTKSIQRQVYGSRAANCLPTTENRAVSTNYQDLWWNPGESGWGINLTHQDNTLFATLFTYDGAGRGLWLVMSSGPRQADGSYLGDLYRTTGPPFNAVPFTPIAASDLTLVGNMRLRFTDGNSGTLSYTYNGTAVNKSIIRQVFSTPLSACN